MPPMKAAAAKKAPGKPSAPKKPTSRSKTGNSACSQAASNWQLAIRGKAPLDPDTYKTLGKCRAMSRASKSADDRADMGYNLSEQGRTALKGRLQKRFDQGLITQKSRQDRLKTLLAQRKEKQATVVAKPEKQPWEMTREDYAASIGAAKPVPTFFGDVSGHQAAFMSGSAIRSRAKQVAARKAVEREAYNAASKKWENSVRDAVSEKKIIPSKIVESDDFDNDVYNLAAEEFMKKGVDLPSPFKLRKMGESRFSFLVDKENQFYRTFSAPAPAPAPAKFSRGGQLAPGRGKDAPEYLDRLNRVTDRVISRSKKYVAGNINNPKAPLRAFKDRGEELRRGLVPKLLDASRAERIRRENQTLAAEKTANQQTTSKPRNYAQAKAERYKRDPGFNSGTSLESIGQKRSQIAKEKTALRSGAIPLSMKPDKIPRGFEATLASGSKGGKIVTVTKPVKGSDYAAVQVNDYGSSGKYTLVDPKSGKTYGGGYSTVKDAETVAKKVDRLVKRASRGLPQNTSVEKIVKSPGKEGYIGFIRDTVLGRNRKRK